MKIIVFLLFSTFNLLTISCRLMPTFTKNDTESETQGAKSSALPITGDWAIVHIKSSFESEGSRKVSEAKYELGNPNLVGTFNLDAAGTGTIGGTKQCDLQTASGMIDGKLKGNMVGVRALPSFFSLISVVKGLVDGVACARVGISPETQIVFAHHDWLGRRSTTLYKNLGVFGEGNKSGDSECQSLRGFRIVEFPESKTIICIGYADASASKLRMLIQKTGEIYLSRVDMVRP